MVGGEREHRKPSAAGPATQLSAGPGASEPSANAAIGGAGINAAAISAAGIVAAGIVAGGQGVAAGSIGQFQQILALPVPSPSSWPQQVGMIPSQALAFQDRAEAARLRDALADGGTAVLGQVLTGLGGVGKTQLAADFARHAWTGGQLDVLVWVTATSRANIVATYAQAAAELLGTDIADPEHAARALLAFLEPKTGGRPCRWLVVLDDVADPADLRGLWPPYSPHGRTVATTRSRDAALVGHGRRLLPVGLFSRAEAVAHLAGTLAVHGRTEDPAELDGLAGDLGLLPLALSQAVAFIVNADITCRDYRKLLSDRRRKLADLVPEPNRLPDEQSATVAATWSLSVERANTQRPAGLAGPMLRLAAFLDPNGIPEVVLTSAPARAFLDTGSGVAETEAKEVLRVLHNLNLIDHAPTSGHRSVRIHQLIQRAATDGLNAVESATAAHAAADALESVWPPVGREGDLGLVLRTNIEALRSLAGEALMIPDIHAVLFAAGQSMGESGQVAAARDHFEDLALQAGRRLGPGHADTLLARGELARWQGKAGDPAGAAQAYAELLSDQLRVQGPDHPHTLAVRHNLAYMQGEAGDPAGAAEAYAELLADSLRVLGPDHPGTLSIRGNLAYWQGKAGDPAGAAKAFAELLTDRLRVLGPDHPDTLAARRALATWEKQAGDSPEGHSAPPATTEPYG